jgi:hypothetical protein
MSVTRDKKVVVYLKKKNTTFDLGIFHLISDQVVFPVASKNSKSSFLSTVQCECERLKMFYTLLIRNL